MYITQDMTDEQKEQVRKDLGLDRSMMEQYTEWAKRAVQGDFGVSLANKNSVAPQIMNRLPATIQLMGAALLLSLILAIPLGLVAGAKKNTWIDNFISSISYSRNVRTIVLAGNAIDNFLYGKASYTAIFRYALCGNDISGGYCKST